jgi:hypothetical protein
MIGGASLLPEAVGADLSTVSAAKAGTARTANVANANGATCFNLKNMILS